MGNYFVDVERAPEDELSELEVKLLLALMEKVARSFDRELDAGSFIIDGQAYGKEAQLIVRGNFGGGTYSRRFFQTYERTSDNIAETSIDEALAWPATPSRYQKHFSERFFEREGIMYPHTGIYQDGELSVLVLNATHGRFLVSIKAHVADDETYVDSDDVSEALLYSVSEALCMMMREDATLQRSATQLILDRKNPQAAGILMTVVDEFAQREMPEMKDWFTWRESVNGSNQVSMPFA